MSRPNILLIITDQQRWDTLGCVTDWMHTPHMDRIAREGVRFTNCVTNSPVCIPTRRSLASGLYPHNTGVWDNVATELTTPSWMAAVRDAGYRTSLFGKTHLNSDGGGDVRQLEHLLQAQGIDDVYETLGPRACAKTLSHMTAEWEALGLWEVYKTDFAERFGDKPWVARPSPLGLEHYYDTHVGRKAREYLEHYERREPWFCWVSFGGPHEPWDAPEPYASAYDPEAMPAPLKTDLTGGHRPRGLLDDRLDTRPALTSADIAAMRANYAGNVELIDAMIGEILAAVEARGEIDNTVIALTSDHGEMNGDVGLLYKSNFLESAVRVPFILRTPASATRATTGHRGPTCDSPIEWFDLGPTLVDLAGGRIDYPQFAQSLTTCVEAPETRVREESLSEFAGEIMLRNEQWKLAVNRNGESYLLFDLENDPLESRNLAGLKDYRPVETELRLHLLERLVAAQLA